MFKKLRPAGRPEPTTERGERIYAIGDIHGRYDLLRELLDKIGEHSQARPPTASQHLILLGDLVDRGPQSRDVLSFLNNVQKRSDRLIILMGNHEEMLTRVLDATPGALDIWLRSGGRATLRSLGVEIPDADADHQAFADRLRSAVPGDWRAWLRGLPLTARSGDYFFCHAGVRPGVPLKRQARTDLLWIRDDFLEDDQDHGAVVVHGHSISTHVEMRHNRIGIDTGAYRTGVLTALFLEGAERETLATGRPAE